MFRDIVSRLSFSPALVGQLSFYAKRLRKEQATRRIGLIFTALALVVQSFAVFQAPESANAATSNDFVVGGLGTGSNVSIDNFLKPYDNNTNNLHDIMDTFGITREEIKATTFGKFYSTPASDPTGAKYSWGHNPRSFDAGSMKIYNDNWQQVDTVYGRSSYTMQGNRTIAIYGFIGYSKSVGWFALMQVCGNLVTKTIPPQVTPPKDISVCDLSTYKVVTIREDKYDSSKYTKDLNQCSAITVCDLSTYNTVTIKIGQFDSSKYSKNLSDCQSLRVCDLNTYNLTTIKEGQYDPSKYSKDFADCESVQVCDLKSKALITIKEGQFDASKYSRDEADCSDVTLSKSASNSTQGNIDASTSVAKADDRIIYTLTVKNAGSGAVTADFVDKVDDVLDYATIIDTGGGTFDKTAETLTWPSVKLAGGAQESRSYTVKLLSSIPSTPTGQSDPTSYDCKMDNVFGNGVIIPVNCETPKVVEQVVEELPHTGPTENMTFAAVAFAMVTFFYYRSKQMNKEVRLIRRHVNTGTL